MLKCPLQAQSWECSSLLLRMLSPGFRVIIITQGASQREENTYV